MDYNNCLYKAASQLIVQLSFTQWTDNSNLEDKKEFLHLLVNQCSCCPPFKNCSKWYHFNKCNCEPKPCLPFYKCLQEAVYELLKKSTNKSSEKKLSFCGKHVVSEALKYFKCSKPMIEELVKHTNFRVRFTSNQVSYQIGKITEVWSILQQTNSAPWITISYPPKKKIKKKPKKDPKTIAVEETLRKMELFLDPRRSVSRGARDNKK